MQDEQEKIVLGSVWGTQDLRRFWPSKIPKKLMEHFSDQQLSRIEFIHTLTPEQA